MQTIDRINAAASAAGVQLYHDAYMSTAKALAQRQLQGRTHYADSDTLRFFGARINSTRQDDHGLWFALRESVQPPHAGRAHRWAIFDIFGRCVGRTDDRSNGAAADRLFSALRDGTDWEAHTLAELEHLTTRKEQEARAARHAMEAAQ
jgi:hypothetical protein